MSDQIRRSVVKPSILAAIDDCTLVRHYQYRDERDSTKKKQLQGQRDRLSKLARLVDRDSVVRGKFGDPQLWENSEELKKIARRLDPATSSPQLLVLLGELLPEEDREALWRASLDSHPNDFWLNFDLGYLLDQKAPDASQGYYQTARALRPETAVVHNNLGQHFIRKNEFKRAIAAYRRAIELRPDYALAHSNLGNALFASGKVNEAITEFRKGIHYAPNLYVAYASLAAALMSTDRNQAVELLQKALRLKPDFSSAHFTLAHILALEEKPGQAIEHYQKGLRSASTLSSLHWHTGFNDVEIHIRIGLIHDKQGDRKAAIKAYQQAVRLAPDNANTAIANGKRRQTQ